MDFTMEKVHVLVFFGGNSSEYEISCVSAASIVDGLEALGHTVHKMGITRTGSWRLYTGSTDKMRNDTWHNPEECAPALLSPDTISKGVLCMQDGVLEVIPIDVVFPALHGRNGEDGTVQGLFELAEIPYVGCDVLASAACMDKVVANTLFEAAGIAHTPWISFSKKELEKVDTILPKIKEKLQYPIFVKPAVGGSSVGITKAKNDKELRAAIELATQYDKKILFEQGVEGKEVECAVIGNDELFGTLPGEVDSCNEVYDYEAKYQSGDESKLYLPARLPQEKLEEVQSIALKAYKVMGCTGLSRVDFFVEKDTQRVLLNEINTLPGFTNISMYSKLMEMSGVSFGDVLEKLLVLALERNA